MPPTPPAVEKIPAVPPDPTDDAPPVPPVEYPDPLAGNPATPLAPFEVAPAPPAPPAPPVLPSPEPPPPPKPPLADINVVAPRDTLDSPPGPPGPPGPAGATTPSAATNDIKLSSGGNIFFNTPTNTNAINSADTTLKLYADNKNSVSVIPSGIKVNVRPSQWIMTGSQGNGRTFPGKIIGATSTNQGEGFSKVNVYGDAKANDFNSGTGTFTAPTDGLYHVQLNMFNNKPDTFGRNIMFVSTGVLGGQQYAIFNGKSTGVECSYNWTQMVWLSKGDKTYFLNQEISNVENLFWYGPSHTNLSIIRIY